MMPVLAPNSEHMRRFHDEHFGPAPTQEVKCPICGERFTLTVLPTSFDMESAADPKKKGKSRMTLRVEYVAINTHTHPKEETDG